MMLNRLPAVILFTIIAFNGVQSTPVSSCTVGDLPVVEVLNCAQQPCTFYINENAVMTMKFYSPRYLEKIAPKAIATVQGLDVLYPFLGQDDACDGITNTPCPIAEGEYVEYTYEMYIAPIFPPTSFTLTFSLVDKEREDENVVCFKLDVQVENPPKH